MNSIDLKNSLTALTELPVKPSQKIDQAVFSIFDRENSLSITNTQEYTTSKAGPFLNIDLSTESFNTILSTPFTLPVIQQSQDHFWLEYFSPNIAKPLHIGHVRNVNTGVAIENLLRLKYPNLTTDSHLGDWGVQFGIILWSIKQLKNSKDFTVIMNDIPATIDRSLEVTDPVDYYSKLYIWGNQQEESVEDFQGAVRQEFALLEQGDSENYTEWQKIVNACADANTSEVELLGMRPADYSLGESAYEKAVKELQSILDTHQLCLSSDKARYIDFTKILPESLPASIQPMLNALIGNGEDTELGRGYLISSAGYSTYLLRDVAARLVWARDYNADKMLTITDVSQNHHFRQIIVYCAWLAIQPEFVRAVGEQVAARLRDHIQHIGYGRVSLESGKMSTRKGNFVTAGSVIADTLAAAQKILKEKTPSIDTDVLTTNSEAITRAALKWNDLKTSLQQETKFSLESILNFEGNTGVYQLYTYARLNSILTKNSTESNGSVSANSLTPNELTLLRKIFLFSLTVEESLTSLEPHRITNSLYDLAQSANTWYSTTNVTHETDVNRKTTLLALCSRLTETLKAGNQLLGISTVSQL